MVYVLAALRFTILADEYYGLGKLGQAGRLQRGQLGQCGAGGHELRHAAGAFGEHGIAGAERFQAMSETYFAITGAVQCRFQHFAVRAGALLGGVGLAGDSATGNREGGGTREGTEQGLTTVHGRNSSVRGMRQCSAPCGWMASAGTIAAQGLRQARFHH